MILVSDTSVLIDLALASRQRWLNPGFRASIMDE